MLTWIDIVKIASNGNLEPDSRVVKTAAEWRALLTAEQFRVTRQKGIEKEDSSELVDLFDLCVYTCVGCGTHLFDSEAKFAAGCGWPCFDQPYKPNAIAYYSDSSGGMSKVQIVCNACKAHLGHVFPDGPTPSGLRYCVNGVALKWIPKPQTTKKKSADKKEKSADTSSEEKKTVRRVIRKTLKP